MNTLQHLTKAYWDQLIFLALPKLLLAVAVLTLFWLLARLLKKYSQFLSKKAGLKPTNSQLAIKIMQGIVYVLGITSALGSIGVDVRALITGLGIGGFALGFAMKDIVSNLLAGLLFLIYKPFKIGNEVEIGSTKGKVAQVNMRYTVITDGQDQTLIPNAKLLTDVVVIKQ